MNCLLKKAQTYQQLRAMITSGRLKPGQRLPGEAVLSENMQVARGTLRSALELLEQDHLIERVDRKGTFVSPDVFVGNYMIIMSKQQLLNDPYLYIFQGMEGELSRLGYHGEICSRDFVRGLSAESFVRLVRQNSSKGIFLMGNNYTGEEYELSLLRDCGIPVVVPHGVVEDRDHLDFALMYPDYRTAFSDGVLELLKAGHRRIATISDYSENPSHPIRRFSAEEYGEFLASHGADSDPSLLQWAHTERVQIRDAVFRLMHLPEPPTAILCFSDFVAIHVYSALEELEIRIPDEVSVMGFCGYPGGKFMNPSLSTVNLCYDKIGVEAVRLMVRSSEWYGQQEPLTVVTPHEIVMRDSVKRLM